jgi:uncharacterized protein YbjT (DUF2867 family)
MSQEDKIILVAGATGQQGGAVARELLGRGWPVRALTRDPGRPAAQDLAAAGAQLIQGDMEEPRSLDRALEGAYGVFSVQNFWLPGVGAEGEVRQGVNLADAARAAGAGHFVYSSVGSADRAPGVAHFESKWEIEQHVRALSMAHTILRPVAFMENYNRSRAQIMEGVFPGMGLRPEKTFQIIAVADIGVFAALAFEDPGEWLGRTVELAGDELTEPQIADHFSRAIGRPVRLVSPAAAPGRPGDEERARMWRFFNEEGYAADIPALRRLHPGLRTFERWLGESGWASGRPG